MMTLENVKEKLQSNDAVAAAFITGSYGDNTKTKHSDLDLVIILKENVEQMRSVYTWIDDVFSDIFIFELADLKRIEEASEIGANSMDDILVTWIEKSTVLFDKSGELNAVRGANLSEKLHITNQEKLDVWQRINYAYIANIRYFEAADDEAYREALDLRLLNSVVELTCGYLNLRDIPWRGEKYAVSFFKEKAPEFFASYKQFLNSSNTADRYSAYTQMVQKVFPAAYELWTTGTVVAVKKEGTQEQKEDNFWSRLMA